LCSGRGIEELSGDADPLSGSQHRAGDQRIDVEIVRDVGERGRRVLVANHGTAGRDAPEPAEAREVGAEHLCDAVGEVVLRDISGEVLERQDCQ
jgi:hypothetical protein